LSFIISDKRSIREWNERINEGHDNLEEGFYFYFYYNYFVENDNDDDNKSVKLRISKHKTTGSSELEFLKNSELIFFLVLS
jgi:hypothetical protein